VANYRKGQWVRYSGAMSLMTGNIGQVELIVEKRGSKLIHVRFIDGTLYGCWPNLLKHVSPELAAVEVAKMAMGIKGDRITIRRPPTFSTSKET